MLDRLNDALRQRGYAKLPATDAEIRKAMSSLKAAERFRAQLDSREYELTMADDRDRVTSTHGLEAAARAQERSAVSRLIVIARLLEFSEEFCRPQSISGRLRKELSDRLFVEIREACERFNANLGQELMRPAAMEAER